MNIVSVLGAGGTERRGNGAGQTGRQCGRLDRWGFGTCHSLACPVARQQQTKYTHNSVTTDMSAVGEARGVQE